MPFAEIAINAPVMKLFHYHIPPHLEGRIMPGHLVRVSFGVGMQPGIVVGLVDESQVSKTKPVSEILDPDPVMTPMHIQLGLWMSHEYLSLARLLPVVDASAGVNGQQRPPCSTHQRCKFAR